MSASTAPRTGTHSPQRQRVRSRGRRRGSRLSLKANFTWTFAGNGIYAACQWGMLVIVAKLGTPSLVGQFALALAVTAPVLMLTNLQLRGVQATDARREYEFSDYLGLRLLSSGAALIAILAIAAVSGYGIDAALTVACVGLAKVFESISDIYYGLLQQRERMDLIAISMSGKGLLSLAVLGLILETTHSIAWGAAGLAASWLCVLLNFDVLSGGLVLRGAGSGRGRVSLRPRWKTSILRRLTLVSLPLGLVMMLISLNVNVPRYFIEHYLGPTDLGFYAAMAYLMVAGTIVVAALGQSSAPRLSQYYALGNRDAFTSLLVKTVCIGFGLGLVGVFLSTVMGPWLLAHLYRPAYASHADVFVWIMVAAAISYVAAFLGYGMTASRQFKPQLPLFLAATGTTALACAFLVPRYGLLGAAQSLVISACVECAGGALIVARAISRVQAVV